MPILVPWISSSVSMVSCLDLSHNTFDRRSRQRLTEAMKSDGCTLSTCKLDYCGSGGAWQESIATLAGNAPDHSHTYRGQVCAGPPGVTSSPRTIRARGAPLHRHPASLRRSRAARGSHRGHSPKGMNSVSRQKSVTQSPVRIQYSLENVA